MCAERTAIGKMISHGYKSGDANLIVVTASSFGFSPCGNCRQVISDMEIPYISYYFDNEEDLRIVKLDELIPDRFSLATEEKRIVSNNLDQNFKPKYESMILEVKTEKKKVEKKSLNQPS